MTWKPFPIRLPMSGRQTIHGPYAALMALMIDWPKPSPTRDVAISACNAAIDGSGSVERAYSAFVAAVESEELMLSSEPAVPRIRHVVRDLRVVGGTRHTSTA
jgi:hypothetical protein